MFHKTKDLYWALSNDHYSGNDRNTNINAIISFFTHGINEILVFSLYIFNFDPFCTG